ncbi:MAG: hypothetical protein MK108_04330 [Mariniblastus sp.]|nr:hypothetical protein [Mariniblastus sp.]
MTLRVQCPEGCLISTPVRYAGKVVRCPGCQLVIQIPRVSNKTVDGQPPNTIRATRAKQARAQTSERSTARDDQLAAEHGESNRQETPTEPIVRRSKEVQGDTSEPTSGMTGPPPVVIRKRLSTPAPVRRKGLAPDGPAEPPLPRVVEGETQPDSPPSSDGSEQPGPAFLQEQEDEEQMLRQFQASTSDRKILARFYSACVFCTGVFNLLPAIYFWSTWDQVDLDPVWPRWAYLQIFVAGLHFIYAIYLYQIPDWSTLRTIAVAMLVLAMMYGVVSSGLLIGGGQGTVAHFLMLPSALLNQAAIWCVAMLCLATLISYLTGRESALWCRTEKLLNQILTG